MVVGGMYGGGSCTVGGMKVMTELENAEKREEELLLDEETMLLVVLLLEDGT